jgi:hypothetical protein
MTTPKKRVPPYFMCAWDVVDAAAIQALQRGEATPAQQQNFLKWLIQQAAGAYEGTFHPESDRASAFAEGRRFVGLQCVKLLAINTKIFVKRDKE